MYAAEEDWFLDEMYTAEEQSHYEFQTGIGTPESEKQPSRCSTIALPVAEATERMAVSRIPCSVSAVPVRPFRAC